MKGRGWIFGGMALAVWLAGHSPAVAGSITSLLPRNGDPARQVCIRPIVASQARCTFDTIGVVRDSHGFVVAGAEVSDGTRRAITNRRGFFDLFRPLPSDHRLTVRLTRSCSRAVSVTVDTVQAISNGGIRRDVSVPCSRPSYNAFGFGFVRDGRLGAVARTGIWHSEERGWLETYALSAGGRMTEPEPFAVTDDDVRNAAGGFTKSGAMVVFYSRFDVDRRAWRGIDYVRTARDGTVTGSIPTGRTVEYSPYGPIVVLPSGRLMQTFYGWDGRTSRVYIAHSGDDGRSWTSLKPIDAQPPFQANEAAAAVVGGATDATASIVLVARAKGYARGRLWRGLCQYVSPDGGRTWRRLGRIVLSRGDSIPWVARVESGRVALVYADRGTMTLRRSITPLAEAFAGRWWDPVTFYHSRVPTSRRADVGDFGYPSIASFGTGAARQAVVFNDVDLRGSIDGTDVDLLVLPLWAGPDMSPTPLSP
ncbi:MAG: exo-alpha-sialidase [Actinomycetota bacterium]